MKELIERVVGFVVMVAIFIVGTGYCGWYIRQNDERMRGALALAIAATLAIFGWNWIKDRVAKKA